MQEYATTELTPDERARIIKSSVAPRPIAWISSIDEAGNENLAPFSSYNYVSSRNPVILFNCPHGEGTELKDTPRNVLETEEFAVNVVTKPLAAQMDKTAAPLDPDKNEFDFANLKRADCRQISAPRVADAVVTMECTLHDSLRIYDRLSIFGDVEYIHVSEKVLTDGKIDMEKIEPIGRLGGPYYTIGDRIELKRQF